jgi:hypothetical protein
MSPKQTTSINKFATKSSQYFLQWCTMRLSTGIFNWHRRLFKDSKEIAHKLYFSTDLTHEGMQIVRYYCSRFQIEF